MASQEALSEWQIKNTYNLIMKGIGQNEAGLYQRENLIIAGASNTSDFLHVDNEMQQIVECCERYARLNVIEGAKTTHQVR